MPTTKRKARKQSTKNEVGKTKTVGGKTYKLNKNHRWELEYNNNYRWEQKKKTDNKYTRAGKVHAAISDLSGLATLGTLTGAVASAAFGKGKLTKPLLITGGAAAVASTVSWGFANYYLGKGHRADKRAKKRKRK